MATKFIVFSLLVTSAYGSGGYSSFSYGVADPNTGDIKDQHEKRIGDSVVGKYSLLESDGTKRIVEYAANSATGFNAIVRKEPAVGAHPGGPLTGAPLGHGSLAGAAIGHGPLAHPAPGPVAPAVAHHAPIAPVAPVAHPIPGAAGPLVHPGAPSHLGTIRNPTHPAALAPFGAVAHPGALGSLGRAGGVIHPGTFNPHVSHLAGAYPGGNRHSNLNAPQGVPAVSHFSHSVVHEIPRAYSGPYAGGFNSASGAYGAYGGHGAHGKLGAFGSPLGQGWAAPVGSGLIGAPGLQGAHGFAHTLPGAGAYGHGLAHSFNSLTRGEAYPHGYGGYGARGYSGGHGAGYGSGFGGGATW